MAKVTFADRARRELSRKQPRGKELARLLEEALEHLKGESHG